MKTNVKNRRNVKIVGRTIFNKLFAIALIMLGLIGTTIYKDSTFLVFTLMFGIPLFFSKRNWIS